MTSPDVVPPSTKAQVDICRERESNNRPVTKLPRYKRVSGRDLRDRDKSLLLISKVTVRCRKQRAAHHTAVYLDHPPLEVMNSPTFFIIKIFA
ncbi:hypothetical protein AVEN_60412-1 [Araneus ventricosus]|uniref:Uncharacterized protein n=1 Tax=Araneus ventricosus TaxID=182803 RepID=A0A4Y2G7K3_ARAVE|nr:hypothetical protein AVEN_25874-1 [Araneus ventricosus]GBM49904.1 hypothetical protein AVEN_60412-1 [Araneus ventricosus]